MLRAYFSVLSTLLLAIGDILILLLVGFFFLIIYTVFFNLNVFSFIPFNLIPFIFHPYIPRYLSTTTSYGVPANDTKGTPTR